MIRLPNASDAMSFFVPARRRGKIIAAHLGQA
jgi:hypothetical protein